MRAPAEPIYAPWLAPTVRWVNARRVMMHELRGHAVLVEFWDFCRPNSLRTLPYVKRWHERYAEHGLRVLGIHSPGFAPSREPDAVRAAVARLGVSYPVAIDSELELWREYGNLGWPARYLFDGESRLFEYHYGEGAYDQTEAAICELLGIEPPPEFVPLRPEDAPGAVLQAPGALVAAAPTAARAAALAAPGAAALAAPGAPAEQIAAEVPGPYSGAYVAGGVWAVLDGAGTVTANGRSVAVDHPGAHELIRHERSTRGQLALEVGPGVRCHAVCFTPGLA
jgi:thiol-disulfide isomerase/thioredoxin